MDYTYYLPGELRKPYEASGSSSSITRHTRQMDSPVWQGLEILIGADLRVTPTSYLCGVDDFQRWLADLRGSGGLAQTRRGGADAEVGEQFLEDLASSPNPGVLQSDGPAGG